MENQEIITAKKKEKKKIRSDMEKRAVAVGVLRGTGAGVFAFLLGTAEMLFGTYPLGFALLSSVGKEAPFVLAGLILGALAGGEIDLYRIFGACAVFVLRWLARIFLDKDGELSPPRNSNATSAENKFLHLSDKLARIFCEHTYLRMMSGAVGVFLIGISSIIRGGFRFYDLFGAIFYLVMTPLATFLFSPYFIIEERKRAEGGAFSMPVFHERMYDISKILLSCALIFSLDGVSAAGISLSVFCSVMLTLVATRRSLLFGTVSGLALGLSSSPTLAPMCALVALGYASISKLSVFGGAVASCLTGMIWCIYTGGFSGLATIFPALLCATMLFCTAQKIAVFDDIERFFAPSAREQMSIPSVESLIADKRVSTQDEKLRSISDAFSTLSEIFYNLSSKLKRPTMLDLRRICEENFERCCESCEGREHCYGAEYGSTLDVMKKMTVSLHSAGIIEEKKLPESFKRRCPNIPALISDINHACAVATKRAFQNEKTEIFALDYDAVAKILNDAIAENEEDFKSDTVMGKKLAKVIADEGYGEHSVVVYGKRKLKIIARGLDLTDRSADVGTLKASLEEVCGVSLAEPTFELAYGSVNMHTEARSAYSVTSAFVTSRASGESVCGDSVSIFENKNGYLYALISDGMGKGHSAALVSEMCNAFLRNMLTAGNRMETSLRMLNSVVRAKGTDSEKECSATVDLLQFDMYSGEMTLVKSGAAPTFVLRRGNVFKLSSPSFPIGILRALDAKQIELSCEDGDIVVMVSDGAISERDDLSYLCDMLREPKLADESAEKIADRVCRRAKVEMSVTHAVTGVNADAEPNIETSTNAPANDDDLSVVVIKVKKELCKW